MKRKFASLICLVLLCASLTIPVLAAPRTYEPKPGSAERKAIMDALRKPISKTLKRKVIFKVHHLKVSNGWAWAIVTALKPDGSELGEDDLWGSAQGLLRKRNGKWQALVAGMATDISVMEDAKKKYPQAPRSIFKDEET